MEELSGIRTSIADPWLPHMERWGGQDLQPHQTAAIDRAAAALDRIGRTTSAAAAGRRSA
jgi:hypothetical protein